MWNKEPSEEMEKVPGRGWLSFSQVILGCGLPVRDGKRVLAFVWSFSMCEHSLAGVTVRAFLESRDIIPNQSYHDLDQDFRSCWMSQQEERELS